MKKTVLSFVVALSTVLAVSAQTWSLDKSHAKLGFSITHLMLSEVDGAFKTFDVKLTATKDDFSDAAIELTADINSINTDNADRDKHLKSADFFDAEKFPSLSFKGLEFKKVEGKKYSLSGNLTLHGVTRFVKLDVIYNGTITHPYSKKPVAGFKVTGTLKRSDFGISISTPEAVLSDEVKIIANAEFIKD
jgi:polyisoprenoid-binding protein YceI